MKFVEYDMTHTKIETRIFLFIIMMLILGQRVVVTIGTFQFPIIIFLIYISIIILISSKKIEINKIRFFLYLLTMILSFIIVYFSSILLSYYNYSLQSLFYYLILYFPFVFQLVHNSEYLFKRSLLFFQKLMLYVSYIGILQLLLQTFGIKYIDIFEYIPESFVQQGFNTTYPAYWGSLILKSNGMFFLEPSIFSQFLAISIIIEIVYFKRISYLLSLFIGILSTLSGTGLMVVLILGIINIRKLGLKIFTLIIFLLLPFTVWFLNTGYGNVLINRLTEFGNENASGSIRFIAPYKVLFTFGEDNYFKYLFGIGPGQVDYLSNSFAANYSVIPKLFIEYGLIIGVMFCLFLLTLFIYNKSKIPLIFAVLITYLFLGGNLLIPQIVYLIFIFISIYNIKNKTSQSNPTKRGNL